MYQTIHSVIVSDGKGGAKEIAPGSDIAVDVKEAAILLRIGAIKAIEGKPEQVAEAKAPSKKELAARAKAEKEAAEAAAAAQAAAEAEEIARKEADEAAAAAADIDNFAGE